MGLGQASQGEGVDCWYCWSPVHCTLGSLPDSFGHPVISGSDVAAVLQLAAEVSGSRAETSCMYLE